MKNRLAKTGQVFAFTFTDSLKAIFTDGGAILVLLIAAVAYPIIYSIAYSNEVITELSIVLVDNDQTTTSRTCCKMLDATPKLRVAHKASSLTEAEAIFWDRKAYAIVIIPNSFERDVLKGVQATVSLYADASNFLLYKETLSSATESMGTLSAGIEVKRMLAKTQNYESALDKVQPIETRVVQLYNPTGGYGSFVMPAIFIIIIQQTLIIGIGLVGGAGRERKRNINALLGVDARKYAPSVILGKSTAYFLVGLFNYLFISIIIYYWFGFPNKGVFLNVLILAIPFLFSVVFMGMAASLAFKHREQSIMFLVFLTPVLLFITGLSWPLESIPPFLHGLFKIFPSTYMVPAFIRLRTMGVELENIQYELLYLTIQMIIYYLLAVIGFRLAIKRMQKVKPV